MKLINLISQANVSAYTSKTKIKYKLIDTLPHAIFRHNLTLIFYIAYQRGELNNPYCLHNENKLLQSTSPK